MARSNLRSGLFFAAALLLLALVFALPPMLTRIVENRLHAAAARRGYTATWSHLALRFPRLAVHDLRLTRGGGDTVFAVDSLEVTLRLRPLLLLRVRPGLVRIAHATVQAGGAAAAEEDSLEALAAPEPPAAHEPRPADPGVRAAADALVRLLLVPARELPETDLADVTLAMDDREGARTLHLDHLRLAHRSRGTRGTRSVLEAEGFARLPREVPFDLDMTYDHHDRVTGHARFGVPDPARGTVEALTVTLDGTFHQRRRQGAVAIDSTIVRFGDIPVRIAGGLERRGPRIHLKLEADSLTAARWRRSVPRPVLGPLLELDIAGAWDQRLSFDLDLAEPDSVTFDADVIPHGMRLAGSGALDLPALEQPFVARIHLPNHTVERDLSERNPHFRPLAEIDSNLVHAVVTNEDGAFFRHGGFNMDAVRQSIAENARAGRFRRGAGTITMQLVRNLYLGHERTISRKWQEVALAWIIEHLTPVTKARLLEIYLNIIEWGPDVHGADEATRFYFGHDASQVTPDEALFLATVVPAPSKWKWRLERDGTLRAGTRAQMHFIGRRMIDKGWLAPSALPPADSLRIALLGPARDLMLPDIAVVDDPRFEPGVADSAAADSTVPDTTAADSLHAPAGAVRDSAL